MAATKPKPPKQPNAVQLDALKHMAASPDGRLVWKSGGFWTGRDVPLNERGAPTWYIPTLTMRAMERHGWITRTNTHAEGWKDERTLTDLGRASIDGDGTQISLA